MLDPIFELLSRAQSLQQDFAVNAMDKPATLDKVVELNTQGQLYDKGVDSEGTPLEAIGGNYSPKTKRYKAEQGQRYDHVTLEDTGEFYASEKAEFTSNGGILLTADTIKDGEDIQDRWGKNILGLTTESQMILKPILTDDIIKETRQFLQGV